MVNRTFVGQSAPGIIRRKLDGALGVNPFQPVDIAFNVYNTQEVKKVKQATVFLETVGRPKEEAGPKRGRRGPWVPINVPIAGRRATGGGSA